MITRQRYLAGLATHREYYTEIAEEIGIAITRPDAPIIQRAREALKKGDKALNSIPLAEWDNWALSLMAYRGSDVRAAFQRRGDFVTDADLVCLLKTVVKNYIEKEEVRQ